MKKMTDIDKMYSEYATGGLVSKNVMSDYFLASAGKMTEVEFVGKHKMSTLEFEKKFAEDNSVDITGTEKLSEVATSPEGGKVDYSKKPKSMAEGGIVGVDPVSGNDIPIGSTPENVRDDVPAMLSEGEYVIPADVLKYFGVNFFEKLRTKAKQGMMEMEAEGRTGSEPMSAPVEQMSPPPPQEEAPMMAEGGLVGTPSFDPLSFSAPGVPMSGQSTGPAAVEYREYYGPGGIMQMFLFVNGEPVNPIPEGFSTAQSEPAAQAPAPTNTSSDNDRNDRNPRVNNTTGPDVGGLFDNPLGALDFADTDAVGTWAEDKLERSNVQKGVGMLGLGGALGSTALELRHIAEVSAAAQYYSSIEDTESADRLMGMANEARKNYGVVGSWSEKFSDGDRIFENYKESLTERQASSTDSDAFSRSGVEYTSSTSDDGKTTTNKATGSTAPTTSARPKARPQDDEDKGRGGYTGLKDMFDGGGPGKSGDKYERNKGGLVTKPAPKPKAKPKHKPNSKKL